MIKPFLLLFCLLPFIFCNGADGNPHNWDRLRRCDQTDYSPPCGLCEGYGGIAYGDENDQIRLTTCTPVANASEIDKKTLSPPYFPLEFTNTGFYEVLIGKKTNFLCLASFPGPDSIGPLCYQEQEGVFHYDWSNYQLRIDYNQKGAIFNTTLNTIHREGDMWINLDYKLVKQCICTDVGRNFGIKLYPVNPYFMKNDSTYLGRERLFIEYIWQEKLVDHWVKGPHHVWVDVETGYIIRMWQPFNGLEVFDPSKWVFTVDRSLFEAPPALCKKGGAFIRIKCDDNGHYNGNDKKSQVFLE